MTPFERVLSVMFIATLVFVGLDKYNRPIIPTYIEGTAYVATSTTPESEIDTEPDTEQYFLAKATGDHSKNACWFQDETMFHETVTVKYIPQDGNVIGLWDPNDNSINIMVPGGLNTETVSHEVSHMVDSFMEKYSVLDPHFEAYMQGYFTDCIHQLMMYDIEHGTAK